MALPRLNTLLITTAALLAVSGPAVADAVDQARLLAAGSDAEQANWLTFGNDSANQRYSKLEEINRDTVADLALAWEHRTGAPGAFQTQPLVVDGMMVITTLGNHATALDAATGETLWHYEHVKRFEKTRAGPTNRGPAIGHGKVYQATNDGRMIALDRATGELVWDSLIATPAPGEVEALAAFGEDVQQAFVDGVGSFPAKMPPLVADGKVIAGVISAGYGLYQDLAQEMGFGGAPEVESKTGRRGYLVAFDAETGWFYAFKREDGSLLFKSEALVPQSNMFTHGSPEGVTYAPGSFGGASWSPSAFHPRTGFVYVPAIHKPATLFEKTYTDEESGDSIPYIETGYAEDGESWGVLFAVNVRRSGRIEWQVKTDKPLVGGVLATAGDLIFMGEGDGHFNALDADTGERLWRYTVDSGINAPAMTYQAGGRQYVAIAAGGSRFYGFALLAFALPDGE